MKKLNLALIVNIELFKQKRSSSYLTDCKKSSHVIVDRIGLLKTGKTIRSRYLLNFGNI